MNRLIITCFLFACLQSSGQPSLYTTANAHSHNDYEQPFPFWSAWRQGFGSMEVDIFLENDEIIVAHDKPQLKRHWTLDSLYLQPLLQCVIKNNGYVYADTSRTLQLLVDIKSEAVPSLAKLVEKLRPYTLLINSPSLQIVISGNRPEPSTFSSWPPWVLFDGDLQKDYNKEELTRIAMFSDNFSQYSSWNGKGRLPEKELLTLQSMIKKSHQLNKKMRFWNAPDILNSWYSFIDMRVDYINTDHIESVATFFKQLPDRIYTGKEAYNLYSPQWKNDGLDKPVRNVILLIGDGTGLAQWYAGYTANKGKLNVFNMRQTGLSKTSSFDNYITDSAPGATAFSSGSKTNNRAVGVDHTGKKLILLPEIVRKRKIKTGIITSGDLRDATPAAFYAHQAERSNYPAILKDLVNDPVDIIMGACDLGKQDSASNVLKKEFNYLLSIDSIKKNSKTPLLVADARAALSVEGGRGDWAQKAFQSAIRVLSQNKEGFLLILEGAQIDHGGHANKLPYAVSELLDFDRVIGEAMKFADSNGRDAYYCNW
ncbi:MAG: alkaline phosphatase [Bacteroidota bacterium]